MKIFKHTSKEKGMWRGWFENGQSLEIVWPKCSVAFRVYVHSNEDDVGDVNLNIGFGFIEFHIPLGIHNQPYTMEDDREWGFDLSKEFGIGLGWNRRRKHFRWPFHTFTYKFQYLNVDAEWDYVIRPERPDCPPVTEDYNYVYTLKSGDIQHRIATVGRQRHILARHILHRLFWPKITINSIEVEFNDEVGERTGSWKGGTVGCGYTMLPGETALDTLRRMERERTFR